jgi:hypothetical protein
MKWWVMWHVWGRGEVPTVYWWGNLKERDHLEDLGMNGRIMLKCIFKTWTWTGLIWLGMCAIHTPCECSDEPSSFIKCREFVD